MIKYIENKKINWDRIKYYLKESEKQNQWTNFGPVSEMLEARIAEILLIENPKKIIATSSGTTALHAIINMHEHKAKKSLKWVVSAFGFPCTKQGPLKNAQVVDCNTQSKLNINKLMGLDYDGIVVTDPFSQMNIYNYKSFNKFCKENNKVLVFDCCSAFSSQIRYANSASFALSFHHTKPWGMGEGGCAIIPEVYREKFKSIINFGFFNGKPSGIKTATNGKISDINAAFILDRLEDVNFYKNKYKEQYKRIIDITKGLYEHTICISKMEFAIPPNVPLLAPVKIVNKKCNKFVVEKYYKSLDKNCHIASKIFEHIVNVPCHPEMEQLSDKEILESLKNLLNLN